MAVKKMTNKEVAELAGVSGAAVSRYFNGGYLSAEKRERIAAAIEETGYVPSANARILRTRKSNDVGVILATTDSRTMGSLASGLEKCLYTSGYGTTIAYVGDDSLAEATAMRSLLERQVDGIALVTTGPIPADIELFERARVPVVIVGQKVKDTNCVYFDSEGAAYDLACSLHLGTGAKVAYVDATDRQQPVYADRRKGMVEGLRHTGVADEDITICSAGFTTHDSCHVVRTLLKGDTTYDLIACASDTHAAGALKAIREHYGTPSGPGVPRVSGFGNDPVLQAVAGPIPTVDFDYEQCGIKAAEMMATLIKGEVRGVESLRLGYRLVGID